MQPFRGTHDQLPEVALQHHRIVETVYRMAQTYGFETIVTPIFEHASTFTRTLGEVSDIVTKEMFSFPDRHGETLVLRPEGTAGVMRAVLTHKLYTQLPLKFFYSGPMFRYERPQKGRQRQFHHVGIECIGDASPLADVEAIALAYQVLRALLTPMGMEHVTLEINTLGDEESRNRYRQALVTYFNHVRDQLSPESQERLTKNPLRILDSKAPEDRELIDRAPCMGNFLTDFSKDFFKRVCDGLEALQIPYVHNPYVVRGLDYYCHTVFEFTSTELGAQSAVLAGGRYDGLSTLMGGPFLPSVGWAAGVERLVLLSPKESAFQRPVVVVGLGTEGEARSLVVAHALRHVGIRVERLSGTVLKTLLKRADKLNGTYVVIMGDNEIQKGAAQVKNLDDGHQETIAFSTLTSYFMSRVPHEL